jgi:hypothetical protein
MSDVRNPWNAPVMCIKRESLAEVERNTMHALGMTRERVERAIGFLVENGLAEIVDARRRA